MRGPSPQAVILASDTGARLYPLNGPGAPKALLPVANRPLLSFPLAMVEDSGIRHVLLVCAGKDTAGRVQDYISKAYEGDLHLEVKVIAEGLGSAEAIRAIADCLVADNIVVLSADLVSDVPLAALLATHTVRGAAATSLLHPRRHLASAETKPGKAPKNVDYVGLDASGRQLLFFASSPDARRDIGVPLTALRRAGAVTLRTDLVDAHCYVFSRTALLSALQARPQYVSLKQEVIPYLARHQHAQPLPALDSVRSDSLKLETALNSGMSHIKEFVADMTHAYRGDSTETASLSPASVGAFLASGDHFCARANTPASFADINRDIATPALATRLLGPPTNPRHETWLDPGAKLGSKSTVSAGCIIAAGSVVGDKSSVKRSVLGPGVTLGSNVRVINSVLMANVAIADGAHIQNSILCEGSRVGEHAALRDCQVGAGYAVTEGADHRGEALARNTPKAQPSSAFAAEDARQSDSSG